MGEVHGKEVKFSKWSLNYSGVFEDTLVLHFKRYTLPHLDDGLNWKMEDNLSRKPNSSQFQAFNAMYISGNINDN